MVLLMMSTSSASRGLSCIAYPKLTTTMVLTKPVHITKSGPAMLYSKYPGHLRYFHV